MSRNIIKLAGGTYARLKALSGSEVLKDREVVISKDTSELFVGNADGTFNLLGNVIVGENISEINNVDPEKGRFFFNSEKSNLYFGTGTGWKLVGINIARLGGLATNEITGEIYVNIDNNSIIMTTDGKLSVGNTDYGEF